MNPTLSPFLYLHLRFPDCFLLFVLLEQMLELAERKSMLSI
jgi:hypothetical protein